MFKIVTIIGARPQIIKAAALSRAIKTHFSSQIKEIIVHTGQHYDENMSQIFFDELGIPVPDYNLNVGSGSHGKQTATMITGIEEILVKEKPNAIVLYGDTNSTLAGGIAASKIHVPVVHIEAGLRSRTKAMPEEVNRIMCDHVSTLLFSPTKTGYDNLVKEGFNANSKAPFTVDNPKFYHCGDVMYDNSLFFSEIAEKKTNIISKYKLEKNKFILATIHRNNNTDEPERLNALFGALNKISLSEGLDVILPLHPRTAKLLETNLKPDLLKAIQSNSKFHIAEPASFLEMIALEKNCKIVMTDSGGVQKEAFYFEKPCVILRPETEWIELVQCGANFITGSNTENIITALKKVAMVDSNIFNIPLYGNGNSGNEIVEYLIKY